MRFSTTKLLVIAIIGLFFAAGAAHGEVVVPLERETVAVPVGLEDWQLAWQHAEIGVHVLEWVSGNETVDDWTRLFTVLRLIVAPNMTADQFAASFVASLRYRCPGLTSSFFDRGEVDTLLEWRVSGCGPADDQHELTRFIRTDDYLFKISFAQKGPTMTADVQEHWLDVLRQVYLVRCCEADDQGLSAIPLLQLLASFKLNELPDMRLALETSNTRTSKESLVFTSSGFPSDHYWNIYLINVPTAEPVRLATLVADEKGVLRCPDSDHEAAALNQDIKFCAETWNVSVHAFQKGLPIAFAARSTDGAHATYVKTVPKPIVGRNRTCRIELELVSTDARTFVAFGSGFPSDEAVNLSWTYARNTGSNSVRSDSAGTFIAAVNHGGQARGPRKWSAQLKAAASSCKVEVRYRWGEGGMKP